MTMNILKNVVSKLNAGDSTETSPSWASATSSAMETPNGVDQPLAFDFSRKCELNPDGRQQLVLPKCRVYYNTKRPHSNMVVIPPS